MRIFLIYMNDRLARCAFKYIYIFTKYKWEKCLKYYSWNISLCYIYIFLIGFQSSFLCSNQIKRMEKDCFDYIDKYYSYSRFNPLKKWHETFILFSHLQCFLQFYYLPINCTLVCWIRVINLSKKVISSNNQCKAPLKNI